MIISTTNFLLLLLLPGHSERSTACRNRRCRQNYNSNFLLNQFDTAGTARCGTGDLPHQAGRERAAGRCGRVYFRCCWANALPLRCWFSFHFVSLLMWGLPLPLYSTLADRLLKVIEELEEQFMLLSARCAVTELTCTVWITCICLIICIGCLKVN